MVIGSTVSASSDDGDQLTTTMNIVRSTSNIIDATNEYFAMRFTSITIPSNATITNATVRLYYPDGTLDEPSHDMYIQLTTNPATFTTGASDISNRTPTTSTVTWSSANLGAPGFFTSPNLSTQLGELYTAAGGVFNGARVVIIVRGSATATRDFAANTYDVGISSRMPFLSITYTTGTACGGALMVTATTYIEVGSEDNTSQTRSFTMPSTTENLLLVCVSGYDAVDNVTGVTYAGASLALSTKIVDGAGSFVGIYRSTNPATGTNDIVATMSGPVSNFGTGAVSFSGVNQSAAVGAPATQIGNGASSTLAVGSASSDIVFDCANYYANLSFTVTGSGAGQTVVWSDETTTQDMWNISSYSTASGSSTNMSHTFSDPSDYMHAGIAVKD